MDGVPMEIVRRHFHGAGPGLQPRRRHPGAADVRSTPSGNSRAAH
jgi:hypothetical protein